jgi:hypothetical protein
MRTLTPDHSCTSTITLRCQHVDSPELDAELLRARFEGSRGSGLAERLLVAGRYPYRGRAGSEQTITHASSARRETRGTHT